LFITSTQAIHLHNGMFVTLANVLDPNISNNNKMIPIRLS